MEAQIYYTVPTEIFGASPTFTQYPRELLVPVHYLYSSDFTLNSERDIAWLGRRWPTSMKMSRCDEPHFWPLQDPAGFAAVVNQHVLELSRIR